MTHLGGTDIVERLFISQADKDAAERFRAIAHAPLARRSGFGRVTAVLCALFCLPTWARSVHADPPSPGERREARVIEITTVASKSASSGVRDAVIAQSFAPNIVRWLTAQRWDPAQLLKSVPENSDVRIRCWIVLSDPAHAHLYFADRPAEHFLIRNLELSGRFDELDREALSQALELSIRALLDNEDAGMNREETRALLAPETNPEKPPEVAAQAPDPALADSSSGFTASAGFQAEVHSSQLGLQQGPGLGLGYERSIAELRAALWVSGHYGFEKRYDSAAAGLALHTIALRSGAELVKPLPASHWFTGARLGAGLDIVEFTPEPGLVDASAALTPARSSTVPVLYGGLLLGRDLSRRLRLDLTLFATVPLLALNYDVEVASVRQRVVTAWPVRPGISLELAVH